MREMKEKREYVPAEKRSTFFPCTTCSNIMTTECFKDCIYVGDFKHYRQRPGTDIADLPAFPLEDVLNRDDARERLLAIGVYLTALVDYIQHQDEYARNRRIYGRDTDNPASSEVPENEQVEGLLPRESPGDSPHQDSAERADQDERTGTLVGKANGKGKV